MKTELFDNALQTGGIRKRRLCVSVWRENNLKTKLFENDDVTIIIWFPRPSFPQAQSKMTADCRVIKLLCRSVNRKHLMRFQSENTVFKFYGGVWTVALQWLQKSCNTVPIPKQNVVTVFWKGIIWVLFPRWKVLIKLTKSTAKSLSFQLQANAYIAKCVIVDVHKLCLLC